jgi:hypothetical protein
MKIVIPLCINQPVKIVPDTPTIYVFFFGIIAIRYPATFHCCSKVKFMILLINFNLKVFRFEKINVKVYLDIPLPKNIYYFIGFFLPVSFILWLSTDVAKIYESFTRSHFKVELNFIRSKNKLRKS